VAVVLAARLLRFGNPAGDEFRRPAGS